MLSWPQFPAGRELTPEAGTQSAHYRLTDLAARGGLPRGAVNALLLDAELVDYGWTVTWAGAGTTPDTDLPTLFDAAEGYVVFMHGWTGNRAIWEDLPARIVSASPKLIALVVDHNGFGETAFVDPDPRFEKCNPAAAMQAAERWITLLGLRRAAGERQLKTINFVGHSMGGAALFFLDETQWRVGEQTRTALAPALLLHDDLHRAFFDTLGLGIGLAGRIVGADLIEHRVKPWIFDVLLEGANPRVREAHAHIYNTTPHDVIAKTLGAMGLLRQHPTPRRWELMRVTLGNRDRLVGLVPMLALLDELQFDVDQLRVALGTHYLFSVNDAAAGPQANLARTHAQNRALIIGDVLALHQLAMNQQRGI